MFTVYSEADLGSTLISNLFIDKYMKDANDAQLKVYLYLLRMMNAGRTTSIPDMADQFNHTEREIMRSLRYWERRGLIVLEYSGAGDLMSLRMVSPRAENETQGYPVPFRGGLVSGGTEDDSVYPEKEARGSSQAPGYGDPCAAQHSRGICPRTACLFAGSRLTGCFRTAFL